LVELCARVLRADCIRAHAKARSALRVQGAGGVRYYTRRKTITSRRGKPRCPEIQMPVSF